MNQRGIKMSVRLNKSEHDHLKKQAEKTLREIQLKEAAIKVESSIEETLTYMDFLNTGQESGPTM